MSKFDMSLAAFFYILYLSPSNMADQSAECYEAGAGRHGTDSGVLEAEAVEGGSQEAVEAGGQDNVEAGGSVGGGEATQQPPAGGGHLAAAVDDVIVQKISKL